jgi:hypothetical protein
MRESCASGSVGGEGCNALAYPARDRLPSAAMKGHGRIPEAIIEVTGSVWPAGNMRIGGD